jgi:hypothetical protein
MAHALHIRSLDMNIKLLCGTFGLEATWLIVCNKGMTIKQIKLKIKESLEIIMWTKVEDMPTMYRSKIHLMCIENYVQLVQI